MAIVSSFTIMFNILIFLFFPFSPALASNEEACSQLASNYPERVVDISTLDAYNRLRMHHFSPTAYGTPLCIYSPESVDALVEAFSIITANDAKIAIRGQGHSPLPGWADIDGGVTVVTSNIKDISYDEASGNVLAGMGNTWGEVYEYAETFGRLANGARHLTVGLATVLGGGISHLSSKYGFIADSVMEFELLVANGTLIKASQVSNPDLFFALKAGSTNYGILTRVTLATYPMGKVWGGTLVYTNDHRDAVMRAYAAYQKDGQLDTNSGLLSYMAISNNTYFINFAYLDGVERPKAFQPFYNIPTVADMTALYDNFTELLKPTLPLGVPRWAEGETTFLLDEDLYVDVAALCQNISDGMGAGIQGWTMILMPQPIAKSMITESWKIGSNPMAKNLKEEAQMWFAINIGWMLAEDDAKVTAAMTDILSQIDALAKSRGLHHPFIFANDASEAQDPFQSYGDDVLEILRMVRFDVDPTGFFQTNLPGGYKLGL
ncbi:bifunctional solanapyrone synthase [Lojkania enalia]|uniref:Bifunctional solanapyrone synthase n=1 Tax=Lojkania enalia TaxID=147567 RepID=A0A9P4KAE6_9PLEO|nr:bifunctional solanapyrone synthase [Didymosphaeria enalia]